MLHKVQNECNKNLKWQRLDTKCVNESLSLQKIVQCRILKDGKENVND